MRLATNLLYSFRCLLNSPWPWEMISATTCSIASEDILTVGSSGKGLQLVQGFDVLLLVVTG